MIPSKKSFAKPYLFPGFLTAALIPAAVISTVEKEAEDIRSIRLSSGLLNGRNAVYSTSLRSLIEVALILSSSLTNLVTHVFIDEFHVVFENEFSAQFFNSAWRQFRKRNAYPTAITQNVEYLLDSVQASTMLSNSEFVIMLNQAASDRAKLAKLLNISEIQMRYITNAPAGSGLIKYGSALVPFVNRFPKDTKLYQLMTTRPGEGQFANG